MLVHHCGGCGYPTFNEDMCAFCQPVIFLAPTGPAGLEAGHRAVATP